MAGKLLFIDASPRGARSRSRVIANALIARLTARRSDLAIVRLPLWETDLPAMDGAMIEGRYAVIDGNQVDKSVQVRWDDLRARADHFLSFDGYIIATPMWNFGVPYPLKHYIDLVTQPGMLFSNDASGHVIGHCTGKRAIIIAASAMPIIAGGALEALDHQCAYLVQWLRFIGVTDIKTMRVAPTYGTEGAVGTVMAEATLTAEAIADQF